MSDLWRDKDGLEDWLGAMAGYVKNFEDGRINETKFRASARECTNEINYYASRVLKHSNKIAHSVPRTPKKSKNHSLSNFGVEA